jgi:multiple antibiotic resistance protein
LTLIGISIPAFRIAGGVLLFLTALDMLFERRTRRREDKTHPADPHELDDPSVFPLAMPLIAGPGAIASMILLTGQAGGGWTGLLIVEGVMLAVMVLTFVHVPAGGPAGAADGAHRDAGGDAGAGARGPP